MSQDKPEPAEAPDAPTGATAPQQGTPAEPTAPAAGSPVTPTPSAPPAGAAVPAPDRKSVV